MPGTKEIRDKIKIIKSTQKITRAMEMVAASKMRRAQERMQASRPYKSRIQDVISHLVKGRLEYEHVFLEDREVKQVGFIIISSDRGLCGSLNINLFKNVLVQAEEMLAQGVNLKACTFGKKANVFFSKINSIEIIASRENIEDAPCVADIIGPVKVMLDEFVAGNLDSIYVCYNRFVNTMQQDVSVEKLLPVAPKKNEETGSRKYSWDYIYEPGSESLLDELLKRYIESIVYQAIVENISCEQAARMVAMKNATDNAGDLIDEFLLAYNKVRQASITKELAEIVGGAAAV